MAQAAIAERNPALDAALSDEAVGKAQSDLDQSITSVTAEAEKHAEKGKELAGTISKARDELGALKPPSVPDIPDTPQAHYRDPMEGFGSAAGIVAAFGSLLTRRPLVNALNASAGVMNAYRAQDRQAYEDAIQTWKLNFEKAKALHDWQNDLYKEIVGKIETDSKLAQSEFEAFGTALGDQQIVLLAREKRFDAIVKLLEFRETKMMQAQNHKDMIDQREEDRRTREDIARENREQRAETAKESRESHWTLMTDPATGKTIRYNTLTKESTDLAGNAVQVDTLQKMGSAGSSAYKPMSAEEKRTGSIQASTGMPLNQIVSGYGTAATQDRNAIRQGAIDYIVSQTPGTTPDQAAIELAARTVEFQSGIKPTTAFVTRQTVTLKQALDQLELNLQNAKTEMNKLPSSDLSPIINAIVRGEEKWTGDPAYYSLFFFMQAAAQESARILSGGTGSVQQLHEGARSEAQKWASANMTPSSFDAVAAAMVKEGQQRLQIAQDALKSIRVKAGPSNFGGGSGLITQPGPTTDFSHLWNK